MRKLASLKRIDDIQAIPGADSIEVATVGGWKVVVKKGEFTIGDLAVYHEIDSWLPLSNSNYSFLMKPEGENKIFDAIEGVRLRSIKLRGQISQGLLLPLSSLDGIDLSPALGVTKWERYLNTCGATKPKGNFPIFIPKADQERCQNLKRNIEEWIEAGETFEVSEKLDGSSMTAYWRDGEFGVCSRNLELLRDEDSNFWKVAAKYELEEKLAKLGKNIALQGELTGFNVQGNPYKYSQGELRFSLFDIFDIDQQKYYDSSARMYLWASLGIDHAPVLSVNSKLSSMESLLAAAEGKSAMNPEVEREGWVFKSISDPSISFKVISNKWLLKNNE